MNALTITPRQAFEVSRLLDRTGDGILYADGGIVTLLLDVYGTGSPNLALELDGDGEVIARQALTLHRQDADDPCDDFGEETSLVYIDPYSEGARPAKRCECPSPRADGDTCGRCGHNLPALAGEVSQRSMPYTAMGR